MTVTDFTWRLADPADAQGRQLEETLVRRERTALRCGGALFDFTTEVAARDEAGCVEAIRFALRERVDNGAPEPIELEAVVRPRIRATAIERLGPLELPTVRQAARSLLRAAGAQLAARR